MDDWDKFNYSKETGNAGPQGAPHGEPQTYINYSNTGSGSAYAPQPKYVTMKVLIIALIICMVLSATIGAAAYAFAMSAFGGTTVDKTIKTTNYNLARSTGAVLSIQEIIARNENSVVAISTETVQTDFWAGQYVTQGAGSGVVYSEDGYIITNNHVIAGASNIKVTLHDGTEYDATLVATDQLTDVAVIKIDATGLPAVQFGSKSSGYPFGNRNRGHRKRS